MSRIEKLASLVLFTGCVITPAVGMADNCTGYDVLVNESADKLDVASNHSLQVVRNASVIITDDPKSKFNMTTGECSSTTITTPDKKTMMTGHCARRDKDGDTYSIEFVMPAGADKVQWKTVAGTGKFANATSNSGWAQFMNADGKMAIVKWGGTCKD